jgi:psiF repeat-containing protein
MLRYVSAAAVLALAGLGAPALAVTAKEKMETCKFGADDQKLTGAARKKFLSRCMASGDGPTKKAGASQKQGS